MLVFTTYLPDLKPAFSISGSGSARINFARIDVMSNSTLPTQNLSGTQRTSTTRMQSTFTSTAAEYILRRNTVLKFRSGVHPFISVKENVAVHFSFTPVV